MFTPSDLQLLSQKGITTNQLEEQLNSFKNGFPFLKVMYSASVEKGILSIPDSRQFDYINDWNAYLQGNNRIVKFVPASGAASRMFKDLFEFLDAPYDTPSTAFEKAFFDGIQQFAFFRALNEVCLKNEKKDIQQLLADNNYKAIVRNLLNDSGLNYGQLPKGLLQFHAYTDGVRTAMEEHLTEGALYAANSQKEVNLHFTVSPEHRALFEELVGEKISVYNQQFGVRFNISFSEQKPSTDTLAADMNNQPFRDNNQLGFRPGGHGALIENLNDIDVDIVFIKNIDNVVPDSFKPETVQYKKLIAGILVHLQKKIFGYLNLIDTGKYTREQLLEMLHFLKHDLCVENPETKILEDAELVLYIKSKLDRPLRVCGMVKNEGEPGGGPFLVVNSDSTVSLQILESSQIEIDMNDPDKKKLLEQGTHFNPVDLVCAIKCYKGNKFNLPKYVDKNTGFISTKSKSGKTLKALELPGLWNGAMSDWNTIFVEVPVTTFNPVKTVNDLLRKEHQ